MVRYGLKSVLYLTEFVLAQEQRLCWSCEGNSRTFWMSIKIRIATWPILGQSSPMALGLRDAL
jgi:hypothetical protein